MKSKGIEPTNHNILAQAQPSRFIRFHCENDKQGTKNGWCVIDASGCRVCFGNWRDNQYYCYFNDNAMKAAHELASASRKMINQASKDKSISQSEAARKAENMWNFAGQANSSHPYLSAKRVKSFGLKQWNGKLLIPLYDRRYKLTSLQIIASEGNKRFLAGGRVKGSFYMLGAADGDGQNQTILICEGYATSATLHELTTLPCVVAFNANNLVEVSDEIKRLHPKANIIICADNDHTTASNPGLLSAERAATRTKSEIVYPPSIPGVSDFNDLANIKGVSFVKKILYTCIEGTQHEFSG
ncbi:hypothetical protein A1OO_03330 [Enterovibrio norvegicus FF-33]|nr:hypothetical protein A1OO_03330 [Enterovibrio norvegicus FF-33]